MPSIDSEVFNVIPPWRIDWPKPTRRRLALNWRIGRDLIGTARRTKMFACPVAKSDNLTVLLI